MLTDLLHCFSNWHMLPTLNQSSPAYKVNIQTLYGLYLLYACCFWLIKFCHVSIHTYIHTNIYINFLENNFSRPGACPQLVFDWLWVHAWFKNETTILCMLSRTDMCVFIEPFLQRSKTIHHKSFIFISALPMVCLW